MKSILALILVASSLALLPPTCEAREEAKQISPATLLEQAQTDIARGELDRGIATLTLARDAAPQDPAIYNALAVAYTRQGAEPMAALQLEKSLQLDSLQVQPRLALAEIQARNRRWQEAGKLWQQVLRLDPTNDVAALELGRLYLKAKQQGPAARTLAGYIERHPQDTETAALYLEAVDASGQPDAVARAAESMLQTRGDWSPALLAAARAHMRLNEFDRALGLYRRAEALQPLASADVVAVGRCHLAAKDEAEAVRWFERVLADTARAAVDWSEPAAAFMHVKRWPEAATCYQRKLETDSTSVSAWVNLGLCRQQTKEFEAARQALLCAVRLRPDFLRAQSCLATNYVLMDSTRAATRAYTKVIRLGAGLERDNSADLLQAHRYLGLGALIDKDWEAALPHLDQALRLDPNETDLRLYRAQTLIALNRKGEAKQEFETVLQRQPDNKQAKKGLDLLAQYN